MAKFIITMFVAIVTLALIGCGSSGPRIDTATVAIQASADDHFTTTALPTATPTVCPISSPKFVATGNLPEVLAGERLVLLKDGSALSVGGQTTGFVSVSLVALWRPATGKWIRVSSMRQPRMNHGAVALADGRVLVFGGWFRAVENGPVTVLASTEIYDPTTDRWSEGPNMVTPRSSPGGALLNDGRVLVVGGAPDSSAEIFDPVAMTWTPTGPMHANRYSSASLLQDGRVLALGGYIDSHGASDGGTLSAEFFDPVNGSWTPTTPLPTPSGLSAQLALQDGTVIVTGGFLNSTGNLPLTLTYDPKSDAWTRKASITANGHSMVQLNDGRVLVVGVEVGSRETPIYDLKTDIWDDSVFMIVSRVGAGVIALPDGRVLVAGGRGGNRGDAQAPIGTTNVRPEVTNAIPWLDSSEVLMPGEQVCR